MAEPAVDESAVPTKPKGMAVAVFDVQPEAFSHRFSIQGNVETDMNSILTTEFAGLIDEVMVSEGAQASTLQRQMCLWSPTHVFDW